VENSVEYMSYVNDWHNICVNTDTRRVHNNINLNIVTVITKQRVEFDNFIFYLSEVLRFGPPNRFTADEQ